MLRTYYVYDNNCDVFTQEMFQLYIDAKDEDDNGDEDDDLDDIYINFELKPNSDFPTTLYSNVGEKGIVSVDLNIKVQCLSDFYGEDCFTFCIPQDDDQSGHFACNAENGTPLCLQGFQNPESDCMDGITSGTSNRLLLSHGLML